MKKIYIAGSGGMLGEAFYQVFKNEYELKCTDIDLNESWLSFNDFRNYGDYRNDVLSFSPDYLFHLGAHTSLEYSELNPDDAYRTNTLSVEYACKIANELNIPILYISTAGIFDGAKQTYDDWDIPNPLGIYGRSKYLGELHVQKSCNKYLVCRAGWMMGGGPNKDKKFVNKIIKQIESGVTELNVVNDKLGTPTFTHDFAKNVKLLLEKEEWGLYNMVCSGITSRKEVAEEIVSILGYSDKITINEVDSNFFATEYFAVRPPSEQLINYKLNLKGLNIMGNWKDCLKNYLNNYFIKK